MLSGGRRAASEADSRASRRPGDALPVTPPTWLDAEAKREWRRIVKYAANSPGWLETADRGLLAAYCAWWSCFVEAAKDLGERGPLVAGRSSADQARDDGPVLVKNRSVSVMSDATTQLRMLAASLGLSTWHRQRIGTPTGVAATSDDDLLSG